MYADFLTSEFKKWLRDPMMRFMLVYPLLFGVVGRFILPWAAETSDFSLEAYADVAVGALTLMMPVVFGALTGFSILDDRDDNVLTSVRVTPLGIHRFLSFRLVIVFILSVIGCVFVMWFSDIGDLPLTMMLWIGVLASLAAPMFGLLINALAKNKIEGFAVMKGLGTLLILPIAALFFFDYKELLFSFTPGFWPAKAISSFIRGEGLMYLNYDLYFFVGLAYVVILNLLTYRLFLRRSRV